MDTGEETIDDADVLKQVRRQARKVLLQTVGMATLLLAITLALPESGA
jgi:hypothetical protein